MVSAAFAGLKPPDHQRAVGPTDSRSDRGRVAAPNCIHLYITVKDRVRKRSPARALERVDHFLGGVVPNGKKPIASGNDALANDRGLLAALRAGRRDLRDCMPI